MHRRLIIKKTWLSAFSYAQSRISLVFCCSLGFLVPWFSSLTAESDLADFLCCVWRRRRPSFLKHMYYNVKRLKYSVFLLPLPAVPLAEQGWHWSSRRHFLVGHWQLNSANLSPSSPSRPVPRCVGGMRAGGAFPGKRCRSWFLAGSPLLSAQHWSAQ